MKRGSIKHRLRLGLGALALFAVAAAVGLTACEAGLEGTPSSNKPPQTHLTVKKINRSGENRLSSQLQISWWGDDPDGYIVGYEYAINDTSEGAWNFTTKTDSVFVLPIEEGNKYDDVLFKVRAVDNEDARDPDGARLVFPIKNTAPEVHMNSTEVPPDTTYHIASFGWEAFDLDGRANLDHTEIALNDSTGSWMELPLEENFISIEVDNPEQSTTSASLFLGKGYRSSEYKLDGLKMNAENQFYVRVVDKAGAVSPVDSAKWFVKKQTSRILILNDYASSQANSVLQFHKEVLAKAGLDKVDVWTINDGESGGGRKVKLSAAWPTVIDPTLRKTLAQWDHIYWFSTSVDRNLTYAADILQEFFDQGGTLFVSIPTKEIEQGDPILNFIPISGTAKLPPGGTSFWILSGKDVYPRASFSNADTLKTSRAMSFVRPLIPAAGADALYDADYQVRTFGGITDYDGSKTAIVRNPEGNFIYLALDLQYLNKSNNVDEFIRRICIEELGFQQ